MKLEKANYYLIRRQLAISMEQNGPRALAESEIMNANHRIKRDQTHQRILRQLLHDAQELVLESSKLVVGRANVDNEHKRGT